MSAFSRFEVSKLSARILSLLFLLASASAWSVQKSFPSTVNEAANLIASGLSSSDRTLVQQTPKSDLILYHHGWGTGIRNDLGLWQGNQALLADCGGADVSPDSCSMIIIEAVWEKLRAEMPKPERLALEQFESLIQTIEVDPFQLNGTPLVVLVEYLNRAVTKAGHAPSEISFELGKRGATLPVWYSERQNLNLDLVLARLIGNSRILVTRNPPKIVIEQNE